ncbi:MAG: helix-turn-helix transcriptional regulator [Acidobacteriales bacterium]|nr:helix-turn-helix transcriptional regulator [Terriglobales bacterium]
MPSTSKNGDLIRLLIQCRSERDISLTEVARAIRVTPAAVSNIESGKSKPRRTTRLKLEEFLRRHGYFPKVEEAA